MSDETSLPMNDKERKIEEKKKKRLEQAKKELEAEQQEVLEANKSLNELKGMSNELNKEIERIETTIKDAVAKRKEIKKVRRAFLKDKKGFIFKQEAPIEELQEYVIFMMKNNGHTDIIEGAQAGEFYLKTASGKEEKSIMLTANKLTTFNYNGQHFKGWVVHEDNVSPYPQDPLHNAEVFRKTTQKIALNYRDVNEAKFMEARTKAIITYVIIGLVVIYILYIIARNAGWLGGGGSPQEVQTAVEVAKNNISAVANTGVKVG